MKRTIACAIALVAVAPLSGSAAANIYRIVIQDMKFGSTPAAVKVGDTIEWVNRDIFRHTATARDGSFAVDLPAGKTGRSVIKHAGKIIFFCKYHPGMTGSLTVNP
jgi:plastocyanin